MSDQPPPPTGAPIEKVAPSGGTPKIIVWAFILSLLGFLILTAFAAVAMTLTGWKQVKATGKGKGLAIAALVISGLWIILIAISAANTSEDSIPSSAEESAEIVEGERITDDPAVDNMEEEPSTISRTQFEDEWPFTVDEGVIRCEIIKVGGVADQAAAIVTLNDKDYALNGVAINQGFTELTIDSDIWRDNEMTGSKILLTPITQRALALCGDLESGPTPEAAPAEGSDRSDETVGYKLAVIDGEFSQLAVENYERRIAQAAERCQESEMSVADKVVKATQLLDERGITESNMWVMDSILRSIPPGEAGTFDCAEVTAVLVSLRVNE